MDTPLLREFERFVVEGGDALRQHARFEAEQAAGSERYHLFLQWIAARSFAAAQQAAKAAGMRIGLIDDLAIGMDRAGSHAWARQPDLLMGLSIGAPPDPFNPHGQDWGLTGFSPHALVATRLRAVPRHPARRPAPCRRRAHRPRHGPDAPVAGPARRSRRRGRLSRLSARRPAAPARARIASPSCGRDRRGSRHCAARLPRAAAPRRHRRHGRAVVPAHAAVASSAVALARRRGRHDHHPRPADGRRLVARRRHRDPPRARPRRRAGEDAERASRIARGCGAPSPRPALDGPMPPADAAGARRRCGAGLRRRSRPRR